MLFQEDVAIFDAQIADLQQKRKQFIAQLQAECKHPLDAIFECSYETDSIWTRPPARVCRLCGYTEDGWGCGHWKLCGDGIPIITRAQLQKYALTWMTQEVLATLRFTKKVQDANS